MTLEHIVRGNVIVVKKAIGGFEHRAAATGFGQSGTGTLGEGMGQLDQTLGPPQVAEVRVGKFVTAQLVSVTTMTHARLLYTWVALGDTRKGSSPQDTPRGSETKNCG